MIKKIALLFLFLQVYFCFSQAAKADVEVIYISKIVKDSLNRNAFVESINILRYNSTESIYYSKDEMEFLNAIIKGSSTATIQTSMGNIPKYPKNRGQVYKKDGVIYTTLPLGFYTYEFPEPALKWWLLPDKKKIKDFDCQLAKTVTDTGDTFFAWFSPEVISTEGSFRFKGLSGLILEVYNKNKTIEITAVEINKSNDEIKKLPLFNVIKLDNKKSLYKQE